MRKTSYRAAIPMQGLAVLAALASCCFARPDVSNTSYAGTWERGNERIRSTLAIVRDGDAWRARLSVRSSDGTYSIRSGWDGRGEERQDGAKTHDLAFRTFVDPASGRLRLECKATPGNPSRKPMHYVDELVVEPGGLTLSAYTVERDGARYEGDSRPRREFKKVSNEVQERPGTEDAP